MKKERSTETILTLVVALIIAGLYLKMKILFLSAIGLGVVGLFIKPLARVIDKLWMGLSELLGSVSSKVLISVVFYIFLSPLAFIFRLFNKDILLLKNRKNSTFQDRNHLYVKADFERQW